jgi:hypothetical protein
MTDEPAAVFDPALAEFCANADCAILISYAGKPKIESGLCPHCGWRIKRGETPPCRHRRA